MSNTTPLKAIQNGLRKYNVTVPAYEIRQVAIMLEQDIESESCIEPLIKHFADTRKPESLSTQVEEIEVNKEQLESLPTQKYEMVTHSQKMALVSEVSQKLNVQLSESQALEIASNISNDLTDFKDIIAEIKQAIQLFVTYEIEQTRLDFDSFANDLINQYNSEITRVNLHMSNVSSDITKVLEVAKQARKSRTQEYLKQFSIPSTKA